MNYLPFTSPWAHVHWNLVQYSSNCAVDDTFSCMFSRCMALPLCNNTRSYRGNSLAMRFSSYNTILPIFFCSETPILPQDGHRNHCPTKPRDDWWIATTQPTSTRSQRMITCSATCSAGSIWLWNAKRTWCLGRHLSRFQQALVAKKTLSIKQFWFFVSNVVFKQVSSLWFIDFCSLRR